MENNIQDKISILLETLTGEITQLVREETLATITNALGGTDPAAEPKKRKKAEKKIGLSDIHAYIKDNPGSRVSEIKKGLGCDKEHSTFSRNIKTLMDRGLVVAQGTSVERLFFPVDQGEDANLSEPTAKESAEALEAEAQEAQEAQETTPTETQTAE